MKLNVDGSIFGKPVLEGIGRVLKDESGAIQGIFSRSIGYVDSNYAEIMVNR